ncbi:MAG: hypothetical protein JWP29_3030, partial [Rhodoferax sp.]|nr:hypothetical protein [Rhodoferax sp.]
MCTKLFALPWQITVPTRSFDRTKAVQIQPRLELVQTN